MALEVATRRYYRIRDLTDVRLVEADGRRFAVADYDHAGRGFHVMVAYAPVDALTAVLEAARRHLVDAPADRGAILDLHLWQDGEPDDVREIVVAPQPGRALEVLGDVPAVRLERPGHVRA